MTRTSKGVRVLAIDPTSRGFGYAVLEGAERLVDWGVTEGLRADNRESAKRVEALLVQYRPDVLILENVQVRQARRRSRVRALLHDLTNLAAQRDIIVATVSRELVKRTFSAAEARNKEQVADTITKHFPELTAWRPPVRRPWMSEDARMAIFDAIAFGLTHFYFEDDERKAHAA